ncbi:MAG: hypothetical protein RL701_8206, partial [Pseudomonadota bacterium]
MNVRAAAVVTRLVFRSSEPKSPTSRAKKEIESGLGFWAVLLLLLAAGVARSWLATSHDGLQVDEAWHAVAGTYYVRTGDYRLNPEHPPLVKLWVGSFMAATGFKLAPFRDLESKEDERQFVDDIFLLSNDPVAAQRCMRFAMTSLHVLLLTALAYLLRRVFGARIALLGVGLLLLDPTVAAHLPLVLMDLSLALLSAITILAAVLTFRAWRRRDLALLAVCLGCTLATKHSAILLCVAVLVLGITYVLAASATTSTSTNLRPVPSDVVTHRYSALATMLFGACLTLWALYGFRFVEGRASETMAFIREDTAGDNALRDEPVVLFNRSIDDKFAEVNSGFSRRILTFTRDLHLLPRAYLWGLADTLRTGSNGHREPVRVYGKLVYGKTPWYFFPAVLTAKLPLGFLALSGAGFLLCVRRRLRPAWVAGVIALAAWAALHLGALMGGNSGFAGVRHVLPLFPLLALLAAIAVDYVWQRKAVPPRAGVAVAAFALVASALPVMRPWEYYNEFAGGAANAWHYFSDEGVDGGQRLQEVAEYYTAHLRDTYENVYNFYDVIADDPTTDGITIRSSMTDPLDADSITGTVFVNARKLEERPLYDYAAFREAEPVARFGNLLVLHGNFRIPWLKVTRRITRASDALKAEPPDLPLAEHLLAEAVALYPEDYRASLTLGNLLVQRGDRQGAIRAYSLS